MSACATRPPASDAAATEEFNENNDPLEPANRVSFAINDGLDTYVLAPVARAYRYAVPGAVRRADPQRAHEHDHAGPVHQRRRPDPAARCPGTPSCGFVINTTVGVGGMFDVASRLGLPVSRQRFSG
ncbi:MAG: MlaA family lipoprotein [Acetobacteraceae bacterium]